MQVFYQLDSKIMDDLTKLVRERQIQLNDEQVALFTEKVLLNVQTMAFDYTVSVDVCDV